MEVQAIIFDLDGVITETSEYHYQAWKELAAELGFSIDREFNECLKGVSRMVSLERVLRHGNMWEKFTDAEKLALADRKNRRYQELLQQLTPDDVLPGIVDFIKACRGAGLKIALASASRNAPFILRRLELEYLFDCLADAAKVAHSKPAPDIFLAAAEGVGIDPAHCIGVEDAEAGIDAIHAAGMRAIGIGSYDALHKADLLLPDTAELDLEKVLNDFN